MSHSSHGGLASKAIHPSMHSSIHKFIYPFIHLILFINFSIHTSIYAFSLPNCHFYLVTKLWTKIHPSSNNPFINSSIHIRCIHPTVHLPILHPRVLPSFYPSIHSSIQKLKNLYYRFLDYYTQIKTPFFSSLKTVFRVEF